MKLYIKNRIQEKRLYILFFLLFFPKIIFPQLVLNNGAIVNINGGNTSTAAVYLTLNNPPVNPITTIGTGINGIMMETEYSVTKYNLGTATTAITVPYVSSANEFFPLTLTPTGAGVGSGNIQFSSTKASTRSIGWDNFNYMPSDMNNMNGSGFGDNSANAIDRFWIIDALNYTTSPAANYSFTYINAEGASNGGNTFSLANLNAQAFDRNALSWGNFPISGTNTPGATIGTISNVSLGAGQMGNIFRSWTLGNNAQPLPIELLSLSVNCINGFASLTWTTVSEKNSSYFTIEKSLDALIFYPLAKIQAEGNSSTEKRYSYIDNKYESGNVYYRITETDINGANTFTRLMSYNCTSTDSQNESLSLFSSSNQLHLSLNSLSDQAVNISGYDLTGKQVYTKNLATKQGWNNISLPVSIDSGVYLFVAETNSYSFIKKKLLIEKE